MPPKKKTEPDIEFPSRRICAAHEVDERLVRTVPGYAEARSAIEDRTSRLLNLGAGAQRTGCTEIPVVVHVVHRNSTENLSDAQINSQIEVLNQDFRATNADKSSTPAVFQPLIGDARITFKLATTDPDGNATDGIVRKSTSNTTFNSDTDNVKHDSTGGSDAWPADRYLNIWTCGNLVNSAGDGLLGYAQFPGGPADTDGVVILHSAFGNTGTASAPFNLGRTATHEVGHWLNLRHIWGDDQNGCSGSDFVADTPNAAGPNFGTPTFPHVTCNNGPNGDLFMNYMDYTDDAAMFMFTAGQVDRMQLALDGPRSSIGTTGPCDGKAIKEFVKDLPKDRPKDFVKEPIKDNPKEFVKDLPKDRPKDFVKEPIKDGPKDNPKDIGKDGLKDGPKDFAKEPIKDRPKDLVKEPVKDGILDPGPKNILDPGPKNILDPGPKNVFDPPKGFDPGPIDPGPFGPQGATGAMPFVLGGGKDPCEGCGPQAAAAYGQQAGYAYAGAQAAPPDPLLAVVQQLGTVLAGYSAAAAQGTLDPASAQRWQQLAGVYAQIVALLG